MQAIRTRTQPTTGHLARHALVLVTLAVTAWTAIPAPTPDTPPALRSAIVWPGVPAAPPVEWAPVRRPVVTRITPADLPADVAEPGSEQVADAPELPPEVVDDGATTLAGPLVSVRDVALRDDGHPDSTVLAQVPRLSVLEAAGPIRDGRIPVRLGLPGGLDTILAWVDASAVQAGPTQGLLRPWDGPFAFGAAQVALSVPYRTQLDGSAAAGANCGPASIGMILQAYGITVPTARLREQAHRFQGTSGPDTGFLLEALEGVVESYGLEGQGLLENRRYRRWTLDEVRTHLRAGHPVIPQLRYRLMPGREWAAVTYDHYLVLTGVDGDDFLFSDPVPWSGRGEGRITAAQLLRAWSNSDAPLAALAVADAR
ncbi:MAG: C39 family peptidase [Chloroflexi bacterium]|nr:C39 family peptidase [Chloroflexota bacterium]